MKISIPFDMVAVGIVEDDSDVRCAIQKYLSTQAGFVCDHTADSVETFQQILASSNSRPDIVLMDIGLPGMSGIDGIKFIKDKYPEVNVIMLTIYNDPHRIFQSLCAGASGYLLKNAPFEEVKNAIVQLHAGGAPMSPQIARKVIEHFHSARATRQGSDLTDREREIVIGLVDGLSYKMIADRMKISVETVRYHIKHVYDKLHVHSKAEVITKSLRGEI